MSDKTMDNLMEAFAGESQANRKYLAYAEVADKEGHPQVARLFRAAAAAETVHAHSHLRVAGKIGNTADNLKDAVAGETHEFKSMYPAMITQAEIDGNTSAVRSFSYANAVEKVHAGLYQKALDNLGNEGKVDYYVCRVCGHTVENEAPESCPICGSAKKAFFKVD
ncbi:Rubrerythrin [Desulfovibrio sp. X2]|uniref:rubrerythrin family protein n=1 Tax=Desulfovibrio sp. X2 TaxID=941449 RepID=UPI0003589BE7|nr:rubrerythrin family protein [Desulfovibrio sp. X2]EPR41686.1 Rubrerythrin [Desulfovibrio sp. X2]